MTDFVICIQDNSPLSILDFLDQFVGSRFLQLLAMVLIFLVDMLAFLAEFPHFPSRRISYDGGMSRSVEIYPKIALGLNGSAFRNGHRRIDIGIPDLNLVNLLKMVRKLVVEGDLQARDSNESLGLIHLDPLARDGEFN